MTATLEKEDHATTATPDGEHSLIVFDIETGPAPLDVIELHMPEIDAPSNYKDPAKIEEYKSVQREKFIQKAALSPLTGRVLAIGVWVNGRYRSYICEDLPGAEADCIRWFWNLISVRTVLVGFNSNGFDLPFLMRRSWALGVIPPGGRLDPSWRFSSSLHIDLMEMWRLGDRQLFISLDAVSRYLGTGQKTSDGELFYKVLRAFPEEAEAYLRNDVELTFALAKKLRVIHDEAEFNAAETAVDSNDY